MEMTTQPSATPRTDAVCIPMTEPVTLEYSQLEIHARALEVELAAANEKAERYRLCTLKQDAEIAGLRAEKATLQAEVLHQIDEHSAQAKIMDRQRAEIEELKKENCRIALQDLVWESHQTADTVNRELFNGKLDTLRIVAIQSLVSDAHKTLRLRAERAEAQLADLAKRYNAQTPRT